MWSTCNGIAHASETSSQASLEKRAQFVSEFNVAVIDRVQRNALPRLASVYRLRGRGRVWQYLAEFIDCLFEICGCLLHRSAPQFKSVRIRLLQSPYPLARKFLPLRKHSAAAKVMLATSKSKE